MTYTASLEDKLRYLRMSAIRQSLEARNQYAVEHQLSYLEFFELLIEDECARRKSNAYEQRLRKSKLKSAKTLDRYDFSFQPELDQKLIKDLMAGRYLDEQQNIILMGKPGTGKTHLANAFGLQALQQGRSVLFAHVHSLLDRLQQGRIDGSHRRILKQLANVDLLIFDELGFRQMPAQALDDFFELIRARYEQRATIFTSNRNFEHWGEIFGDKILAGAIIDRIVHHAHIIRINGESYRVKDFLAHKEALV
jgi:DNA replication protein DnaC